MTITAHRTTARVKRAFLGARHSRAKTIIENPFAVFGYFLSSPGLSGRWSQWWLNRSF